MIALTELQLDALAESFNIALGSAAAAFSRLVKETVQISVPTIEILAPAELELKLKTVFHADGNGRLCGITQKFETDNLLRTDTILLFPERGSLELIRQMLGEETPIEYFTELEQDALAEIGNLINNSCMSCFADLFGISMTGTLPVVTMDSPFSLLESHKDEEVILVAHIGMSLLNRNTSGIVLFIMDIGSMQLFVEHVEAFFDIRTA